MAVDAEEQDNTVAEVDELDVDAAELDCEVAVEDAIGSNDDPDDPPLQTTELVRFTDAFRADAKFAADKNTRYTPQFRKMLHRPVSAAYEDGKCPEYFEAGRAAYAACYYLREDAHKQDITEQSAAEALRLYVSCEHDLIKSTCSRCESKKSSRFELPFDIGGLKKLTTRIAERLKKQAYKRSYKRVFQQDEVEEVSLSDEDVSDGGATESDIIAAIDAERGHFDASNDRLARLLTNIFSKSELKLFVNPPSKNDRRYRRLLQRFKE